MIAAFVPFFAIKELDRVLGREKLRALFFRKRMTTDFGCPMDDGTAQRTENENRLMEAPRNTGDAL
jgi:hypothetical protein